MESDDDNLNIKVVPLGDVKLFMMKTLLLEAISFSFMPCQNLMSTIRRHFLAAAVDPAVSLSTQSTVSMEVCR